MKDWDAPDDPNAEDNARFEAWLIGLMWAGSVIAFLVSFIIR